jgi:hypothetical protein
MKYTQDDYFAVASALDSDHYPILTLEACNRYGASPELFEKLWDKAWDLAINDVDEYYSIYRIAAQFACEKAGL